MCAAPSPPCLYFFISSLLLITSGFTVPSWSTSIATQAPRVSGHTTSVNTNGRVLLFGGLTGSAGSPCTTDLWSFGVDSLWCKVETVGGPGPRMCARILTYTTPLRHFATSTLRHTGPQVRRIGLHRAVVLRLWRLGPGGPRFGRHLQGRGLAARFGHHGLDGDGADALRSDIAAHGMYAWRRHRPRAHVPRRVRPRPGERHAEREVDERRQAARGAEHVRRVAARRQKHAALRRVNQDPRDVCRRIRAEHSLLDMAQTPP